MKTADKQAIESLDLQLRKVLDLQSQLTLKLGAFSKRLKDLHTKDETHLRSFQQHILQLRFDNLDIIKALLKLNQSFCIALGIDPQNSAQRNLERAAYALGGLNSNYELAMLGRLLKKLQKVYELNEKEHKERQLQQRLLRQLLAKLEGHPQKISNEKVPHRSRYVEFGGKFQARTPMTSIAEIEHELREMAELQGAFLFSIEQLTEAYHKYGGIPKFGLIYDYLAGIKSPISDIFQRSENNLDLLMKLDASISLNLGITPTPVNVPQTIEHPYIAQQLQLINTLITKLENNIPLQQKHLQQLNLENQRLQTLTNKPLYKPTAQKPRPKPQKPPERPSQKTQLEKEAEAARSAFYPRPGYKP